MVTTGGIIQIKTNTNCNTLCAVIADVISSLWIAKYFNIINENTCDCSSAHSVQFAPNHLESESMSFYMKRFIGNQRMKFVDIVSSHSLIHPIYNGTSSTCTITDWRIDHLYVECAVNNFIGKNR